MQYTANLDSRQPKASGGDPGVRWQF